jgi:hypothetical protein
MCAQENNDAGESSVGGLPPSAAGNFLPFRLKSSPNNVISSSYFMDSSKLSLIFGTPVVAQPLLNPL